MTTIVNNTGQNIEMFKPVFIEAMETGVINDDYIDIFKINILRGFNEDGTDRLIVDMVED